MQASGRATAFQHYDWMKAIADHLAQPACAEVLVIEICDRSTGEPLMLLPLCRIRRRSWQAIEFLSLGVSDLSAPVLAAGLSIAPEDGQALWQAICDVLPKADFVIIDQIPASIGGIPNPLALLPQVSASPMTSYDTPIDGDPETIVARLANSQTRRILKTSDRRMSEQGEVGFRHASTPDELDELMHVMFEQRAERFRELGRYDLLALPAVRDFYRNAAGTSLGGRGPAHVFGLSVDGEWIATAYGLVHGSVFHLTVITMAGGQWSACSPGMATIARFIRWSRQNGISTMDFSVGEAPYKPGFGGQPRQLFSLSRPMTAKGRLIVASRRIASRTKQEIKARPALFRRLRSMMQIGRRIGHSVGRWRG
ncbi:GNAT family N-acetyltransferase [Rhizobium sp. 0TCS1.26]|uniref:GNAT family N-acetyltransferase n=1 Tax=Rhizobium sp. 0TCS1.26 TaxID=3142623 RepID=UPI003D2782D4